MPDDVAGPLERLSRLRGAGEPDDAEYRAASSWRPRGAIFRDGAASAVNPPRPMAPQLQWPHGRHPLHRQHRRGRVAARVVVAEHTGRVGRDGPRASVGQHHHQVPLSHAPETPAGRAFLAVAIVAALLTAPLTVPLLADYALHLRRAAHGRSATARDADRPRARARRGSADRRACVARGARCVPAPGAGHEPVCSGGLEVPCRTLLGARRACAAHVPTAPPPRSSDARTTLLERGAAPRGA